MRAALALAAYLLTAELAVIAGAVGYSIPTPDSYPKAVAGMPDGHRWLTEKQANRIGRLAPTGQVTEYSVLTEGSEPHGIVVDPASATRFALFGSNRYRPNHACGRGH